MNNISSRAEYGLRAMLEIAGAPATVDVDAHTTIVPVKRSEIARRQNIPLPFLTQVLQALVNQRLVSSTRGPSGGYVLARDARDITVLEVINALQGPQSPRPCVDSAYANSCDLAVGCNLFPVWEELKRAGEAVLSSYSLADLIDQGKPAEPVRSD